MYKLLTKWTTAGSDAWYNQTVTGKCKHLAHTTKVITHFYFYQGGRGHWTLNYKGSQSFITTLSYSLVLTLNYNKLVTYFSINDFRLLKGKFCNFHWRCIAIYHASSYPCISLIKHECAWLSLLLWIGKHDAQDLTPVNPGHEH